jgi:hypothetical protein
MFEDTPDNADDVALVGPVGSLGGVEDTITAGQGQRLFQSAGRHAEHDVAVYGHERSGYRGFQKLRIGVADYLLYGLVENLRDH